MDRLRWWGWFAVKVVAATAIALALSVPLRVSAPSRTFDGVLVGYWMLPMLWVGLLWLAWRDQRFRCRVCARRLRMPLADGSYAAMLLDRPGVEWVCPFGHGKLRLRASISDELAPKWTQYGDIWEELIGTGPRK